jgi:hypothetical protein
VQLLLEQPTPVLVLAWHAVWHAPQWSAVWSDTQTKLSGRPSGPAQQAGVAPEHGAGSPPQVHVPTHRLLEVREQISEQAGPQCAASAS